MRRIEHGIEEVKVLSHSGNNLPLTDERFPDRIAEYARTHFTTFFFDHGSCLLQETSNCVLAFALVDG